MSSRVPLVSRLRDIGFASAMTLMLGTAGTIAAVEGPHMVSQKGRAFQPGFMTVKRGDTLQIVNDDGDLLHHAYIDSPTFTFDSGDQEPGSRTDIVFSKSGVFNILCGIHPKMKMVVTVDP